MTPQEIEALKIEALKDKVEALSDMVEILKAERDALAAHNSELVSACKLAIDMFVANDCNVPNTIETLQDAIDATPQQCLRDVQVEAGRAGFVAGAQSMKLAFQYGGSYSTEQKADKYAESLRQGGAE